MINIGYDYLARCTSAVLELGGEEKGKARDSSYFPLHLRAMDWNMSSLRDLTVDLSFNRGGETVYKATSWVFAGGLFGVLNPFLKVGFVGLMTGMRMNNGHAGEGYSVSINYRELGGTILPNLISSGFCESLASTLCLQLFLLVGHLDF